MFEKYMKTMAHPREFVGLRNAFQGSGFGSHPLLRRLQDFKTQCKDGFAGVPEGDGTRNSGVPGAFYLERDRLDRASCILASNRVPRNRIGEYFPGDHDAGVPFVHK